MRCLLGFILFWISVGIFISLFIESVFCKVVLLIILMIVGFNLFFGN
jgi:hypothetical protein